MKLNQFKFAALAVMMAPLISEIATGQEFIPRGASAAISVPMIKKYPTYVRKGADEDEGKYILAAIDISFHCANVAAREDLLKAMNDAQSASDSYFSLERAISDERIAAKEGSEISSACIEAGVADSAEAELWLDELVEKGFVPAMLYFSENVPPSYKENGLSSIERYYERKEKILEVAADQGSAEAMYLRAKTLSNFKHRDELKLEKAVQAWVWADVARKCGFDANLANRLISKIERREFVDLGEAQKRSDSLAAKLCHPDGAKS